MTRIFRLSDRGFSLIEVVLALSVAAFAILAVVALLPFGIQTTKDSLEETDAINVMSQIIADRQATPLASPSTVYLVPALSSALVNPATGFFGVTRSNGFSAQLNNSQYRVDYIITPPTSGHLDPYRAWFKVSWPALSATPSGSVEGIATFAQP